MRTRRAAALTIVLSLAYATAAADSTTTPHRADYRTASGAHYKNYFGATAGYSTGLGLSYRRWFNEHYAAQLTLGPYYHEDDNNEGASTMLFTGLTAFRSFVKGNYMRFLGYVSGQYYYHDSWWNYDWYSSYRDSTIHEEGAETDHWIAFGAGAGIELYIWRLAFNLMVGIAPSFSKSDDESQWSKGIMVSPECGLYFRF